jgi:hypothetical protein
MATEDLTTGLLTGLTQGYASQLLQEQQLQIQEKQNQMKIVGQLIASGDFETVKYIDPKVKKSLGFTPELDQHLDKMIILQNQAKEATVQGMQEKVAQSKLQRQATELDIGEKQRRAGLLNEMTPEEQQQAEFPGVVKTQRLEQQDRLKTRQLDLTEEEIKDKREGRAADRVLKEKQIELTGAQIANAHEDRMASVEARRMQTQAYIQESQNRLEQTKLLAAERSDKQQANLEIKQQNTEIKEVDSARRGYESAQKSLDAIMGRFAEKDSKTGTSRLVFNSGSRATQVAELLNNAQTTADKRAQTLAEKMKDDTPVEPTTWTAVQTSKGGLGGSGYGPGAEQWEVVPTKGAKAAAVGKASATATPESVATRPKPQHAFEDLLAPAAKQSNNSSFKLPVGRDKAMAMLGDVRGAEEAVKRNDPQTAIATLQQYMSKEEAENIVKNNLFDALAQTVGASMKGKK